MSRPHFALFLGLLAAAVCSQARAGAKLLRVDYYCPVTFQLVLTCEMPEEQTAKSTANAVKVTRYGNREILQPIVASHGGKLSDWSLVAYASSDLFDTFDDLSIVARDKSGQIVPVPDLDLALLSVSSVTSDVQSATSNADAVLVRAAFEQKQLVTYEHDLFGGSLVASGLSTTKVNYGALTFSGQSLRAFKPGAGKLALTGVHTDQSSGLSSVAKMTLSIGEPRLVPTFTGSGSGTGGITIITPGDGIQAGVSPN